MTKTYHRRREYKQIQHDKTRKAKIHRCKVCKIYYDSSGSYPLHFIWYGAPDGLCEKHRD